jgi:hypothetical protein
LDKNNHNFYREALSAWNACLREPNSYPWFPHMSSRRAVLTRPSVTVALAGPVVVYDLCFQGSTYDRHTISYEADGRVSQAVEVPVQAVGGDGPDQVVGEERPDQAEVQLLRTEPAVQPVAAPGMSLPIPFPAFPLNPANLSHPLPMDGASLPKVPTPDYYALFKSFSDTELVGVWAVNSDRIVRPPDGRSLHNLLENLQLGIGSSGALLEWQGKGVIRSSLMAILRFPHYV